MGKIFPYKCTVGLCGNTVNVETDFRGRLKRVERDDAYDDPNDPTTLYHCNYCGHELIATMPEGLMETTDNGTPIKAIKAIQTTQMNLQNDPNNAEMLVSLAGLQMIAGGYQDAVQTLERAKIANGYMPEVYYLQAISRLQGKAPRLNKESEVNAALQNCDTAIGFEEDITKAAVYKMLKAYIQYDFFESRARMKIPSYRKILLEVKAANLNVGEINALFKLLKVTKPSALNI